MGDGEDDLEALEEEVSEMEAQVKRMRSEGPARFKSLLQEHLEKLRPVFPALEPPLQRTPYLDGANGDVAAIQSKLAEALDALPVLLERINKCTDDLSSSLTKLKRKRSYDSLFELPNPAPEDELDLASRFFSA